MESIEKKGAKTNKPVKTETEKAVKKLEIKEKKDLIDSETEEELKKISVKADI